MKPRYATITLYAQLFRLVAANERRHDIMGGTQELHLQDDHNRVSEVWSLGMRRCMHILNSHVVYCVMILTICSIAQVNLTCTHLALKTIGSSP